MVLELLGFLLYAAPYQHWHYHSYHEGSSLLPSFHRLPATLSKNKAVKKESEKPYSFKERVGGMDERQRQDGEEQDNCNSIGHALVTYYYSKFYII